MCSNHTLCANLLCTRGARGGFGLNRTLGFCAPRPLPSVAGKPKIFLPYFRFSAGGVGGADKKWKGNFWFCFAAVINTVYHNI
ncbi:MAG: hypothetical protein A3H06_00475 [Candidatus Colwellbacteria bacterium RIFCSPLOWO2_12_FULL_44_13]|uniref:Uncharacterized protein n=1 Tax=Candidatus Colwellbacteria bacterium RIFCSPLOWO2_12_FULL_44_13 TaxID=1797694 RepID=A0A1G1Z9P4_9BACT|nr:MAG: hypothetical protein A3H06_00475 [Candidatus Colwellbacteria bacterium RIFCSPLOWO2_12_FULL_44_13]